MSLTMYNPQWGAERPIRGVLFDMDGLIVDTEKYYTRFWQEAAACYGFTMTPEQSLKMRGLGSKAGVDMIHSFFGPQGDYFQLRAKRIQLMEAHLSRHPVEAKPGIGELLTALEARGIAAAVTSSSPRERIERYLTGLGLYHRFQKICSGRELANGKPAPDIYLLGAETLGLDPGECLALEDAPSGLLSAYRAGCLPVMIPDLSLPDETTLPLLYAKADTLADVIQLLP